MNCPVCNKLLIAKQNIIGTAAKYMCIKNINKGHNFYFYNDTTYSIYLPNAYKIFMDIYDSGAFRFHIGTYKSDHTIVFQANDSYYDCYKAMEILKKLTTTLQAFL
jgi:hypothetical protein